MTPECALTKLSYLLSKYSDPIKIRHLMRVSVRGELTSPVTQTRFTYLQSNGLLSTILSLLGKENTRSEEEEARSQDTSSLEKTLVPMVLCQASRTGDIQTLQTLTDLYPHLVNAGDYDGRVYKRLNFKINNE